MDTGTFWKAFVVQGLAVGVLTGILIALPLGDDFFDDFGWLTGPAAWAVCALLTARVLTLPLSIVLFSALAGGVAGLIVLLVAGHWPGVVVALLVFAASCASYDAEAEAAPE